MKIRQLSERTGQSGGAPRQTEIMGQPHMLAYINEAERQMLKRAGGAEAPGPEGIPAYWTLFNPSSWGDGNGYQGISSSSSNSSPSQNITRVQPTNTGAGRNLDADMFAGSNYAPTVDAGTANAFQTQTSNFNSPTSVTAADLASGNYDQFKTPEGGSITVAKGTSAQDVPMVDIFVGDDEQTTGNFIPYTEGSNASIGGGVGGGEASPIVTDLDAAKGRRNAALSTQMGNIGTAFGFSTDDYFKKLGSDYREGGLSEAFTNAYDGATRGIYDTFKSSGMLTQQGVDDSMGMLASAESGEEGRIDGIVDQYTAANRNYVGEGRTGMEGTLQGLINETNDIPAIDAQTSQILGYDVAGNSQKFKNPKEQEVVNFFTDFAKRAYDPSYNVDPTAVASGGPSRVSGSVDQLGAGTQPSTIAGIFDPVAGGSVKVLG